MSELQKLEILVDRLMNVCFKCGAIVATNNSYREQVMESMRTSKKAFIEMFEDIDS